MAAALALAGCQAVLAPLAAHGSGALQAAELDRPFLSNPGKVRALPDYQETLAPRRPLPVVKSWYDVRGSREGVNLDAADLAKAASCAGDPAFAFGSARFEDFAGQDVLYRHLEVDRGPVVLLVGGTGKEDSGDGWMPALVSALAAQAMASGGVLAVRVPYALDPHSAGFWWPLGAGQWRSGGNFDGWLGIPRYHESMQYGAFLVDKAIRKALAAGASRVTIYAHSKGSDVAAHALHWPERGIDRRSDSRIGARAFALPALSEFSPGALGFKSRTPHWGGFWKLLGGRLIAFNRESDFATYLPGKLSFTPPLLEYHDYAHLAADSPRWPFSGERGKSRPWTATDNFLTHLERFAAGAEAQDQSADAIAFDW
jgi:hypothetical protein